MKEKYESENTKITNSLDYTNSIQQNQENAINNLQTEVSTLKTKVSTLKTEVSTLKTEASTLQTEVSELRHVEQGMLDCHKSDTWTDGRRAHPTGSGDFHSTYDKTRYITHTFNKPYTSPPVVFLSTSYRAIAKENNVEYGTKLVHVTSTYFTMFCGSDESDNDALKDMEVDWISVPV